MKTILILSTSILFSLAVSAQEKSSAPASVQSTQQSSAPKQTAPTTINKTAPPENKIAIGDPGMPSERKVAPHKKKTGTKSPVSKNKVSGASAK